MHQRLYPSLGVSSPHSPAPSFAGFPPPSVGQIHQRLTSRHRVPHDTPSSWARVTSIAPPLTIRYDPVEIDATTSKKRALLYNVQTRRATLSLTPQVESDRIYRHWLVQASLGTRTISDSDIPPVVAHGRYARDSLISLLAGTAAIGDQAHMHYAGRVSDKLRLR